MKTLTTSIIDLPGGAVEVRDSGGDGPLVLFIHGALVDGRLWDAVWPAVAEAGYRCVLPNLPLGAHRLPLDPSADRTPLGQAHRIATLIEALGVDQVVLVGNDTGGALCQILTAHNPDLVDRLILTPCDALEHFPPSLFRPLTFIARSPRLLGAALWPLRRKSMRRIPFGFGSVSKRPLPEALWNDWFNAIHRNPAVLRDLAGLMVAMRPQETLDAAERLKTFPRSALIAWAIEDRFFPYSDGEKLASLIPKGHLVAIKDSYTFTPIDQPHVTAEAIVSFLGSS